MKIQPTLLVMAAGLGSRYGSLKQIDQFGPSGETILDYAVYDAIRAGFGKVVFVIRKSIEAECKEVFHGKFSGKIAIDYALQEIDQVPEGVVVPPYREKPWGTGHAVMVAADKIGEPFAVINADDFYGARSFSLMADFLRHAAHTTGQYCLLGYRLHNTLSAYGHVSRGICEVDDKQQLIGVTERTHIAAVDKQVVYHAEDGTSVLLTGEETVSMNLMGFTPEVFQYFRHYFKEFISTHGQDPKAEFYLPYVVNALLHTGSARVQVIPTPEQWFGITYREDKAIAQQKLRKLVAEGIYPNNLWEA